MFRLQINVLLLFLSLIFITSCSRSGSQADAVEEEENLTETDSNAENDVTGGFDLENLYVFDIDNDSIPDSFFVVAPVVSDVQGEYSQDCDGPCITKITFGEKMPPIFAQQSLGGEIEVLEDINEDGYREIVFFPYWFQSCWSRMDIFSFNGEEWQLIRSIDYNSCEESLPTSFEKIEKGLLRVITNGEQFLDDSNDIESSSQELPGLEAKIYDVEVE